MPERVGARLACDVKPDARTNGTRLARRTTNSLHRHPASYQLEDPHRRVFFRQIAAAADGGPSRFELFPTYPAIRIVVPDQGDSRRVQVAQHHAPVEIRATQ